MARATSTAARLQLIARMPASQHSKHVINAWHLMRSYQHLDTNHVIIVSKHVMSILLV
jgi:hypothetical protein